MVTVPIDIPGGGVNGEFTAKYVDANGVAPKDVIRLSNEFGVKCSWWIDGPLAGMLCGCWHLRVAFESVGPGPEFFTAEKTVNLDGRTGPGSPLGPYTTLFTFPVGPYFPGGNPTPLPKVQPEGIGVYEVAVILTCRDKRGNPVPIAASANLEKLTIFDDN